MKFSIVFDKSGDSLEFGALSSETYEVLEYYVDQLTKNNSNCFSFMGQPTYIDQDINYLISSIDDANTILSSINGESFDVYTDLVDYLNQQVLNKYHADWVKSQNLLYNIDEYRNSTDTAIVNTANTLHEMFPDDIRVTSLGNILSKLEKHEKYGKVNDAVHRLEKAFDQMKFRVNGWVEFNNPYPKSLITNDKCNFKISFNHLGRPLYSKYQNFDTDLSYGDENTFDQLLGFVEVSLVNPQTHTYSPEYTTWCQKHKREPSGSNLNIGNVINLNNRLAEYRLIMYRNTRNSNKFSIKLNKGN